MISLDMFQYYWTSLVKHESHNTCRDDNKTIAEYMCNIVCLIKVEKVVYSIHLGVCV